MVTDSKQMNREHIINLARSQVKAGDESLRLMPHRSDLALVDYSAAIHNAMAAGGFSTQEADEALSKYTELLRVRVNASFPSPRKHAEKPPEQADASIAFRTRSRLAVDDQHGYDHRS